MNEQRLGHYLQSVYEAKREKIRAERTLAKAAVARTGEVSNSDIKDRYNTPEKAQAAITSCGESIFNIPSRTHADTMVFGDQSYGSGKSGHARLEDADKKLVAWRATCHNPWSVVIVERISLNNGETRYRVVQPDPDDLDSEINVMRSLARKPEPDTGTVIADSHDIVSEDGGEHVHDDKYAEKLRLRSLQASAETFEAICQVAAGGTDKESITELSADEVTAQNEREERARKDFMLSNR